MKWLQKLGRSLMLPAVVLSAVGILSGIGYALCPAVMQDEKIVGVIPIIGYFPTQVALTLIDGAIIALLSAVGVVVGVSDDHDGIAGLADLVSWLMIAYLLVPDVVQTLTGFVSGSIQLVVFGKIQNALIGAIAGVIGSTCYNKPKDTKLPDWLTLFSGKCYATTIAVLISIIAVTTLPFVWSVILGGLASLGEAIVGLNVVGAGLYVFLNRLLIPFGLHHTLSDVSWFDTIRLGDLTNFWAGKTSADVSWSLGMYMSGFFPCMTFGVPGAALVMVHTVKSNKRKVATGIIASTALCALVCGVTEPFEFAFMFVAPVLYLAYATLYGIFTMITVALGLRAGFSFSAGAIDLLFFTALPATTKAWLTVPLGIAAFAAFYIVFRFTIMKFDLKTPRHEDNNEDETTVRLANGSFTAVAATILEDVGGKENVTSIDNCITRPHLGIKDYTKVGDEKIKSAGVAGVIRSSKITIQVIVGTQVQFVAGEFKKLCK